MKKKKILYMMLMITMLVYSINAYAYTYSREAKERSKTNIYISASIQRYEHGDAKYTNKYDGRVCEPAY